MFRIWASADRTATHGDIVRSTDANGNVLRQCFDSSNRLVERRIEPAGGASPQIETYRYDGLGRIIASVTPGATVARRYDSLSRLLEEVHRPVAPSGMITMLPATAPASTIQDAGDSSGSTTRYVYDYANRLVRVESLRADGTVARAIEYAFLATERLEEAQRERIWAIVEAHQSGLSVRQIAGDIGLSSSRVHQLLGSDEAREIPRWLSQQRRRNRPDRPPQEAARSPHEAPEARGTARKGLVELDQQLARMPREVVLTGGGLTITEVLAVAHRSQRDHPHRMAGRRPPGKVARRSQARSASPLIELAKSARTEVEGSRGADSPDSRSLRPGALGGVRAPRP